MIFGKKEKKVESLTGKLKKRIVWLRNRLDDPNVSGDERRDLEASRARLMRNLLSFQTTDLRQGRNGI